MNRTFQYLLLFASLALTMAGCKPEELVLDPPGSKLEGINDTFTLTEVVQLDRRTANPTAMRMDVTEGFLGSVPPSITFNSADRTFSYDPGDSPDYLGLSGTWAFDNDDYPTRITMVSGGNQYDLMLLQTIRPQDMELRFQLDRSCNGNPAVSYQYTFHR